MARSSRNQILRLSGIPDGIPKIFWPHGFSREFSSRPEPENATLVTIMYSITAILVVLLWAISVHVRDPKSICTAGSASAGKNRPAGQSVSVAHALASSSQVNYDQQSTYYQIELIIAIDQSSPLGLALQ